MELFPQGFQTVPVTGAEAELGDVKTRGMRHVDDEGIGQHQKLILLQNGTRMLMRHLPWTGWEQKQATLKELAAHLPGHQVPSRGTLCSSQSQQIYGHTWGSHALLQRKAQNVTATLHDMALWLSATWHNLLGHGPVATHGTCA